MMLLISACSVLLFTYYTVKATNKHHIVSITVFGLIFLGSILTMIANENNHYGMRKEIVMNEQSIISSANIQNKNLLIYKSLGDSSEKIYFVKSSDNPKEIKETGTTNVKNKIIKGSKEPKWIQSKTYWIPKNKIIEILFNYGKNQKKLISEKNEFFVPKDWLILNADKLKK